MPTPVPGLSFVRAAVVALTCAAALIAAPAPASADAGGSPGAVNFVRPAESYFDRYTSDGRHASFMNAKYWRMRAYGGYFDSRLDWYGDAWAYVNAYAIYRGQEVAAAHPDWILRDGAGNRLYIPFGCGGGTCPQYAGDIGNPAFREFWMDSAARTLAAGYRGLFIDDVNMWLNVGDGNGNDVAPIDPRTGQPMTETAWRRYFATFMEEVRARFPGVEIVHNSVWFAPPGPEVDRQVRAADLIEVERGINDSGLTSGTGRWSLRNLFSYVDRMHQLGAGVILDSDASTVADREYGLAGYFLVSTGQDGLGNDIGGRPDDWWAGYDADLGAAKGPRYDWQGLLRRDFERGTVLLNEPDAPTRTVDVGPGLKRIDGAAVTSVQLGESRGAVLLNPSGAAPALQAPQPPSTTPGPGAPATPAPSAPAAPAPAPSAPAPSAPVPSAPAAAPAGPRPGAAAPRRRSATRAASARKRALRARSRARARARAEQAAHKRRAQFSARRSRASKRRAASRRTRSRSVRRLG